MFDQYLVTGATGFLGRAVAEELVRRRAQVHALVLRDDPYIHLLPKEVHTVIGDVCVESSLTDFFAGADSRTCVIHCAGIVSVASRPGSKLYRVNVGGTWRVLRQCVEHNVGKMVYVGSSMPYRKSQRTASLRKIANSLRGLWTEVRKKTVTTESWFSRRRAQAECQHCLSLRHHRAGRHTGRELHINGEIFSLRKAALCRSRRI